MKVKVRAGNGTRRTAPPNARSSPTSLLVSGARPTREFRATSGIYRMLGWGHLYYPAFGAVLPPSVMVLLPPLQPNYELRRANNI